MMQVDKKPKIYIATYSDGAYAQHACVMIRSLVDVASAENEYEVFYFLSDCEEATLKRVKNSVSDLPDNIIVNVVECFFNLPASLKPKKSYMNASIYNKILIYNHLPEIISRIVFIDADILFSRDPIELNNNDLGEHFIGAVRERFYLMPNVDDELCKELKLNSYSEYFNSGVMVIDLKRWHSENISSRALDFAVNSWGKTALHDQDAFNYVIGGAWKPLCPLWNPRALNEIKTSSGETEILSNTEIYNKGLEFIVHFSGHDKPWLYDSIHPKKSIYLKKLKKTNFSDYVFPDRTLKSWIRKKKKIILKLLRSVSQ